MLKSVNKLRLLLVLLCFIGLGFLIWHERLAIYDEYRLFDYKPPTAIVQLANETTMTPYARHLFYVYHPQLENSTQFNKNCRVTNQAIVQGCTVSFQGIYLYNVQDPQLNGTEQVTAAYEMLHVGYSRLSTQERTYINKLVMQAFETAEVSDPSLKTEEQSYLATEGAAAVPNELHSMMGTEVANLPPALENYYKQYFTNRQAIIKYKNQYEAIFTQRQQTVSSDDQQLATWKQYISNDETDLNNQNQQLSTQKEQLDNLLSSNQVSAYNAAVPSYNSAAQAYDTLINQTKDLINSYNQLVASRNSVALEINQLYQTISSQPLSNLKPTISTQ